MIDSDGLSALFYDAAQKASNSTERSQQAAEHYLGVSDIGHCREYARRTIIQEPYSDERDKTAAFIGTILGAGYEAALRAEHPDWLFQHEVLVSLPSGTKVMGHPDVVATDIDVLIDLKSKDGLEVVKKEGPTTQQWFQTHGYASACIEQGLLTENCQVALVYYDRSGATPEPHTVMAPYDPDVLVQMDMWLEDVFYAVRQGEEAARDKPRDWCERWCERYSACRLYDTDVTGLLEATDTLAAIATYAEGHELERTGKRMKDESKAVLRGVSGHSATHTVRWVEIGPTEIAATTRAGYSRLDLRKRSN